MTAWKEIFIPMPVLLPESWKKNWQKDLFRQGSEREQAQKFGVEVKEMKDGINWLDDLEFDGPVYLSLDLDCLDPAFAPGVSHHEPGGMTTRQVIDIIHRLKGKIIGADIVEYNPDRDLGSMTSMVAAKLLKEIIARIHEDTR
jgi:arginase